MTKSTQTLGFQTEAKQLLHLMTHSLYSNREVFLRELISNASDACDRLRFEGLNNEQLFEGDQDLRIRINIDEENKVIRIEDNGIGMNHEEVIANLGTIAGSGTAKFMQHLTGDQRKDSQLIGQFGVGFYSSFIVSKKVEVITRRAGLNKDEAVHWVSEGDADYSISSTLREQRGTEVILHLKEEAAEFSNHWKLRNIITKYSDHISLPIQMLKQEKEEAEETDKKDKEAIWEATNKATSLWSRASNNIKKSEYIDFYKHITHDWNEPLTYSHNRVEGKVEYISLLYIPKEPTFDLYQREVAKGVKLFIQRTFIMDDADQFLPLYLRFVKGVLDANDLPMNISREMLQASSQVTSLRSALTKRVLDILKRLASKKPEEYKTFWVSFGKVLKEGVAEDNTNKEKIAKLLRFATTHTDKPEQDQSLDNYIERMQPDQDKIYYVYADSHTKAYKSPHIEALRENNIEILLLSDPIDEWLVNYLTEYEGKSLLDVRRSNFGQTESDDAKKQDKEKEADKDPLIERIASVIGERASEVKPSDNRLVNSPACLVMGQHDISSSMRRLMEASGQALPDSKPILEINLEHPVLQIIGKEDDNQRFNDLVEIIFDQAYLVTGERLADPASYISRVNKVLVDSTQLS